MRFVTPGWGLRYLGGDTGGGKSLLDTPSPTASDEHVNVTEPPVPNGRQLSEIPTQRVGGGNTGV